jgi:hypothetical protein
MAQDTGGAIVGAVRADLFTGWGSWTDEAYTTAAALKQPLQMWGCGLGCLEGWRGRALQICSSSIANCPSTGCLGLWYLFCGRLTWA